MIPKTKTVELLQILLLFSTLEIHLFSTDTFIAQGKFSLVVKLV